MVFIGVQQITNVSSNLELSTLVARPISSFIGQLHGDCENGRIMAVGYDDINVQYVSVDGSVLE